jgi:transposase
MMPKRTFTRDYKLEEIQLARTSGKSKSQLERELGLTAGQIGNWEKALEQHREQAFPGTGHQSDAEAELRRVKRELEIVTQERDILKKRWPSSPRRKAQSEVRFHSEAPAPVRGQDHVPSAGCLKGWLLQLGEASSRAALTQRDG